MSRAEIETGGQADIEGASAALRAGEVVVIPTETVYGIAALATQVDAIARIRSLTRGRRTGRPMAWHAPDPNAVIETLGLSGSHRRLVERLSPGPVTFVLELADHELASIREKLGVPADTIDNGRQLAVRIPDNDVTRSVLEQAGGVVVAQGVSAAGWGDGREAPIEAATGQGVSVVVDDGPTQFGRPSTSIALSSDGGWHIDTVGAMDKRAVQRKAERVVMFVCTGNTCRSPMAEAIARHLLGQRGEGDLTTVESAGTDAASGWPMSAEAVVAIQEMGIEPSEHRSRRVTRALAGRADLIFTLTQQHLDALIAGEPTTAGRAHTLDPSGDGVPDPIGSGQEHYTQTAAHIRDLIERRLPEITG